jgi:hypothetical protein
VTTGKAAVFAAEFNRKRMDFGGVANCQPSPVECVRAGCEAMRYLMLSEEDESQLSVADQDIYTNIVGEH